MLDECRREPSKLELLKYAPTREHAYAYACEVLGVEDEHEELKSPSKLELLRYDPLRKKAFLDALDEIGKYME